MTMPPWIAAAGTDWESTLTVQDASGVAINLTGASLEWRWDVPGTADAHVYTDAERITLGDDPGVILLALSPTDTRQLYGSLWETAVVVDYGDGRRREYLRRQFRFVREIAPDAAGS